MNRLFLLCKIAVKNKKCATVGLTVCPGSNWLLDATFALPWGDVTVWRLFLLFNKANISSAQHFKLSYKDLFKRSNIQLFELTYCYQSNKLLLHWLNSYFYLITDKIYCLCLKISVLSFTDSTYKFWGRKRNF